MNKRELALLEKAFAAEIDAALTKNGFGFMQTKSKLADKLVADGLLEKVERKQQWGCGVACFTGYRLTLLGHMTYCMSCDSVDLDTIPT